MSNSESNDTRDQTIFKKLMLVLSGGKYQAMSHFKVVGTETESYVVYVSQDNHFEIQAGSEFLHTILSIDDLSDTARIPLSDPAALKMLDYLRGTWRDLERKGEDRNTQMILKALDELINTKDTNESPISIRPKSNSLLPMRLRSLFGS